MHKDPHVKPEQVSISSAPCISVHSRPSAHEMGYHSAPVHGPGTVSPVAGPLPGTVRTWPFPPPPPPPPHTHTHTHAPTSIKHWKQISRGSSVKNMSSYRTYFCFRKNYTLKKYFSKFWANLRKVEHLEVGK